MISIEISINQKIILKGRKIKKLFIKLLKNKNKKSTIKKNNNKYKKKKLNILSKNLIVNIDFVLIAKSKILKKKLIKINLINHAVISILFVKIVHKYVQYAKT